MIHTCFSSTYYAETPSASMRKLPIVAKMVEEKGLAKLIDPGTIDKDLLYKLHDPLYVRDFMNGTKPRCSSQGWPWTPQIRDGVLAIQAGQIIGAKLALEHGIAANIAQGFHHSHYAHGQGFCTFNGLALVAQQYPGLKVGVLDCDNHYGNGTHDFVPRLPNLYNYSIFGGTHTVDDYDRSFLLGLPECTEEFDGYLHSLAYGLNWLRGVGVGILLYQAGADAHIDDPYGYLNLTTEQLRARDKFVFEYVRKHKIPTLFVLAGGYQEPIETKLAPLHVATFEEAVEAFK